MDDRAAVLGRLTRELRAARGTPEAARIEREIARLSAGTRANPVRETAARTGR